jgi:hypothetical protein
VTIYTGGKRPSNDKDFTENCEELSSNYLKIYICRRSPFNISHHWSIIAMGS